MRRVLIASSSSYHTVFPGFSSRTGICSQFGLSGCRGDTCAPSTSRRQLTTDVSPDEAFPPAPLTTSPLASGTPKSSRKRRHKRFENGPSPRDVSSLASADEEYFRPPKLVIPSTRKFPSKTIHVQKYQYLRRILDTEDRGSIAHRKVGVYPAAHKEEPRDGWKTDLAGQRNNTISGEEGDRHKNEERSNLSLRLLSRMLSSTDSPISASEGSKKGHGSTGQVEGLGAEKAIDHEPRRPSTSLLEHVTPAYEAYRREHDRKHVGLFPKKLARSHDHFAASRPESRSISPASLSDPIVPDTLTSEPSPPPILPPTEVLALSEFADRHLRLLRHSGEEDALRALQNEAFYSLGPETRDRLLQYLTPGQLLDLWMRLKAGVGDWHLLSWFTRSVWLDERTDSAGSSLPLRLKDLYTAVGRTNIWEKRLKTVLYKCLVEAWRRVYETREGIKRWNYSDLHLAMALNRFRAEEGDPYGILDSARLMQGMIADSLHSDRADELSEVMKRAEFTKNIESSLQKAKEFGLVEVYPLIARLYTQDIIYPQDSIKVEESLRKAVALGALDVALILAQHHDKIVPAGILGPKAETPRPLTWNPRKARLYYQIASPTSAHAAYQAGRFFYRQPGHMRPNHMAEWRNIPDDKKAAKYFWLAHEAFSLDASWKLAEMLILNRTEARGPFAEEDLTIPGSNPRLGRLRTAIALIGWIVHRDHIIQPHTRRPDAMEMRASPLMQPDSIMFEHAYTFRSPTKSSLAGTAKKVRTPTNVEDALWQEREEYIRKAMEEAIAMLPEHLRPRSGKETLREKRSDKDDKVSVDLVDQKAGNDREWTEASSQEEDDWDMSIPAGSPPVPEHLRPREERLDTKSVDVFEDEESLAHPFFAPQHEYIYTGSTSEDIGTGSPALPDLQWYKRTTVYFLRNTRLNFLIPMLRVARDLLKEVEAGGAGLLENEDKAIWVDDLNRHRIGDRREKLARKAKTKKLYEENMKKRREKAERTINQDTAKERKKGMTNAEEVVMEDFWAQLKAVRAGVSLKDTPATQTTMEPNISDKSNAPQSWWTDSSKAAALQNIPSTLTSSERAKISQDFALSQDELRDKDRQGVSLRSLQIAFENSHSENADGEQVTTSQTSAGRDGSALLRWAAQQRETISGQQEDTETPPLTGETKAPEPQGRGEDSGWFDVAAPVDNWPDGRTKGNEGSSEK